MTPLGRFYKYHNVDDLYPQNRGRWGEGGLRFRTLVDACRCGDGEAFSLLYAKKAM